VKDRREGQSEVGASIRLDLGEEEKEIATTKHPYPIHDLFIRPIEQRQLPYGRLLGLLGHDEHLLRRFGCAEWVRIDAGQTRPLLWRQLADELWAVLSGTAEVEWVDRREGSPTHDASIRLRLSEPTLLLVPFGVAFEIGAPDGPVTAVRFQSHSPNEDPVQPDAEAL
jgi:hypothetical protein